MRFEKVILLNTKFSMSVKVPMVPLKRGADEHYRYKMQRVISKVTSRGNGVKTIISNSRSISRQIGRSQISLAQWIGYSLGVSCRVGPKNVEELIINGDFPNDRLQNSLYEYIEKFVFCPICENPETFLVLNNENKVFEEENKSEIKNSSKMCKNKYENLSSLFIRCESCGNTSNLIDAANITKVERKMASWLISDLKNQTENTNNNLINHNSEKHKKEEKDNKKPVFIDVDELRKLVPKDMFNFGEDLIPMTPEMQDEFFEELQQLIKNEATDEEIFLKYYSSQKFKITDSTRLNWLYMSLFEITQNEELLNIIEKRRELLIMVLQNEDSQRKFLSFLAADVEENRNSLISSFPVILYSLYRNEIIEPEVFFEWNSRPITRIEKNDENSQILRKVSEIFINWLKTIENQIETTINQQEENGNDTEIDIDSI